MKPKVVAAAIGQCVHVAGLDHFLQLCEQNGWQAISLGPAVPVLRLLEILREEMPTMAAISYRLTAEDAIPLFQTLKDEAAKLLVSQPRWIFGGTPPVAAVAKRCGLFERVFDGTEPAEIVEAFIRGKASPQNTNHFPQTLVERINAQYPMPLLRHHYGEPDLARTVRGVRQIARAEVLDVLSIGPDQNAQEHFFHPEDMDIQQNGAGGVPLRKAQDLSAIYKASRTGNYPLLRCYSGTRDLTQWAEMSLETINNAWGAIPLCWYSVLDGRSTVPFPEAIREKLSAIRFYAMRGIPVEVNESHQWSLRDSHDALAVAMAFLAAYNAKVQGVTHYIIQMMHNTPPSTSPVMDLAKMTAKLELIEALKGPTFHTYHEVRAGITSLPFDCDEAKGHMAASAIYAMTLRPHIFHVVGYSEASHVVDPKTLIESCRIARGAIRLALQGAPDMSCDPIVTQRRRHLVSEAKILLAGIRALGTGHQDPWADPEVLSEALRCGLLDTPHFRGTLHSRGHIATACINGGWDAIDPETRCPIRENERIHALGITL